MEDELNQLKSVLRGLVVSSPTQMDVRSLLHDYRNMVGSHIPLAKFGYKDLTTFLRERCSDCFLGPQTNPVLTLIVPDTLKHVDQFVQKQRNPVKNKVKRRSVPESVVKLGPNLIINTFTSNNDVKKKSVPVSTKSTENQRYSYKPSHHQTENYQQVFKKKDMNICTTESETYSQSALQNFLKKRSPLYDSQYLKNNNDVDKVKDDDDSSRPTSSTTSSTKRIQLEELKQEIKDLIMDHPNGVWCTELLKLYRARHGRELNYSGFGFMSVLSLASSVPGVTMKRQPQSADWLLGDARRGLAPAPGDAHRGLAPMPGDMPRGSAPPAPAAPATAVVDDALPGVSDEADVYPADGIHFLESIPQLSLADAEPGALLEVVVGEVYSPSHFWLQRLGERHNIAMEEMMDDMNRYYNTEEGRSRRLALGAVRVGHYCSSRYDDDWHRSLIVKILDYDMVKVRHVDYGTVDRCAVGELRVLRREWAALPAQATRARLAAVRPCAGGRRWPRAAALHFLELVRNRRLVASVAAADPSEATLEVFLVDTATDDDVCIGTELVRAGHADPRPDSALGTTECYLYPRFDALEGGATPNFAEIHAYLRDGIALEYVEDYRRHVPPSLPPSSEPDDGSSDRSSESDRSPEPHDADAAADTAAAACPAPLDNRVPLFGPEERFPTPPPPPPPPPPPLPKPCARLVPRAAGPRAPAPDTPIPPPQPSRPVPPAFVPLPQPFYAVPFVAPVLLSASEVEAFALLSRVDVVAAHRFMVDAVSRALSASRYVPGPTPSALNPDAAEFRMVPAQTQLELALASFRGGPPATGPSLAVHRGMIRPPPGFENY